jgi:hypothetical protein
MGNSEQMGMINITSHSPCDTEVVKLKQIAARG